MGCRVLRVVSLVLMAVVLLFCVFALAMGVRGMAAGVFLEHFSVEPSGWLHNCSGYKKRQSVVLGMSFVCVCVQVLLQQFV